MLQFSKLLLSFLCLQAMLYATDEKIPNSALQLIKKLSAWEEDLEKKFLEERSLKRKQVAQALNSELDRATRKGDLNGAIALREYINNLSSDSSIEHSVYLKKDKEIDLYAKTINTLWTWPLGAQKHTIYFAKGNKILLEQDGGQQYYQSMMNWKQIESYTIEFERKGDWPVSGRIEFDRDFKSAKINIIRRDGQKVENRINRIETD